MDFVILIALVEAARSASAHPFPFVGGIAALKSAFEPVAEYSATGHRVDLPAEDGEPVLWTSLVTAHEVSEAGHGYEIRDSDRFFCNRDGDLVRLASSGVIPSDWMGEVNTVGSIGRNRYAGPKAEMLDALGVPEYGPYELIDDSINWPLFCKERRANPDDSPAKAYKKARWHAGKIRESGGEPVPFHEVYEPIADVASEMLPPDPWQVIAEGHLSESRALGRTDWEDSRLALAADRARRRAGQRDRFTRILGWIQSSPVDKVRDAFKWHRDPAKRGQFYRKVEAAKAERAGKDDALLTSDQTVILSMAAALATGRTISKGQKDLFETACDSSPWEAWKATGVGKYEIQWLASESANPFDDEDTVVSYDMETEGTG